MKELKEAVKNHQIIFKTVEYVKIYILMKAKD